MVSLVESGTYGAVNKADTSTNGFYVIMFTLGAYTLQENTSIDEKIITAGELVVKSQYLFLCKYTLIGIIINNPNIMSSQYQHAQ